MIRARYRRIAGALYGLGFLVGLLWILFPSPAAAQDEVLTLEAAIRIALVGNERAISADQQYREADARLTQARAYFLPTLSISGNYTRRPFEVQRIIGNQPLIVQSLNALSAAGSFSLNIFDSHSLPTLLQADAARSAQDFSTTEAKRKLAFDVGNAFLAALSTDRVMEASKHRFDFSKQSLEAARARYSAGLVSVNDVTRAELDYATAELGITQVQGQVETTYNQLGFLLNAPTPKKLEVPDFLLRAADEAPLNIEQLVSDAQNRRPDVNSLRMQAKAQHALVVEPALKWLPTLALTGRYSYTNEAGLTGRNFNWNAGLSMSWSVFDGLARNGSYSERTALAYEADLNLRTALRKVDLDVHNAVSSLATYRAAVRQAAVALDIAQKNATQTAELYRQGISSVLQVADANVQLFYAEVALVTQRYSLGTAYLNLESALGLDPLGKESRL